MFAVAIELLGDRYVATAYNDREQAEWPPHPARLFSALVATWAEAEPHSEDGQEEELALRWLEQQEAPHIIASASTHASRRTVVPVFVPVNDRFTVAAPDRSKLDAALESDHEAKKGKAASDKLSEKLLSDTAKAVAIPNKLSNDAVRDAEGSVSIERRAKQPRTFPSVTPSARIVEFRWPQASLPRALELGVERLLRRLVRLGHSSSFVRAALIRLQADEPIAEGLTRYVPNETDGDLAIRWVARGQLERLVSAFERHHESEPRVLSAAFIRYREGERKLLVPAAETIFDPDFVVLARVGGPRLPITSVAGVSRQLRNALMSVAEQPVAEVLSGHRRDGAPSEEGHLAIVPLPFVGTEHADGSLMGIGLILPRRSSPEERQSVYKTLGRLESKGVSDLGEVLPIELVLGSSGVLELERIQWGEPKRATLTPRWWNGPSCKWASATPLALDQMPGNLHDADPTRRRAAFDAAEQSVRISLARMLPALAETTEEGRRVSLLQVDVVRSCVLPGSAKPRDYPRFPANPERQQRVLVHVRLVFDRPVRGPLVVGAGRYQGLGLFFPVDAKNERLV